MGREPIIRNAIVQTLNEGNGLMRFKEIKKRVASLFNRDLKDVHDHNIAENLKKLINLGTVEKKIITSGKFKGHLAYQLTHDYYRKQIKARIVSLLEGSWSEKQVYSMMEGQYPPLIVFTDPFADIKEHDRQYDSEWGGETRARVHVSDLGNVNHLFATRMLETFLGLKKEEQEGIGKLLAWAYWCSVNETIEEFLSPAKTIEEDRIRSQERLQRAEQRGDYKKVEIEKSIISILGITEKLLSKRSSLKEFLNFARDHNAEVKKLQNRIIQLAGQFTASGERIYDNLFMFHDGVRMGLVVADLLSKFRVDFRPRQKEKERYLFSYSGVWGIFIGMVFRDSVQLEEIKGDMKEAVAKTKAYKEYLKPLVDLPYKSRICAVYIWGFPEAFELSDKGFVPMFGEWVAALKEGRLDHRRWIFTDGEKALVRAIKALKKKQRPLDIPIDHYDQWTILNLYNHHPKVNKDRERALRFFQRLLDDIRKRKKLANL